MRTIKELYDKAKRDGNHNIIVSLDARIKKVLGVQTALKPIEFVDVIINDYNYYTQNM